MTNHQAVITSGASAQKHADRDEPESRVLATIALSFDASLGEIFRTLVAGATLCLARREALLPGPELVRLLHDGHITHATLVTTVLAALPRDAQLPDLHTLTVGGEALPAELAAHWGRGRRLLNGYGPTETTIGATLACDWDLDRKPPLGRPLAHVRAYVLDGQMQLLPIGVPGELYLGGPTLARGYLNRPDQTAERFLPDPFGSEPGARLYRTGDRVRWLADGQLEFIGRVDEQVKVRGHRIEPGEIEAVLRQHAQVREAVVLAHRDGRGEQRLIAYVLARHDVTDQSKATDDLVTDWQRASEGAADTVKATATADPRLNFSGWLSSYTDQPIPLDEMRFWADDTVERIAHFRPKAVFEIGCGTGLILLRLAPHCRSYVGVDFAAGLVEYTRSRLYLLEGCDCQVELRQRRADDLGDWPDGSFDCVVINSVVQYFPDVDYLLRVLREAVRLVRAGGQVFVGDVRNLRLLEAFHASVQLGKAAATLPAGRLAQRMRRFSSLERELLLDPRMFAEMLQSEPRLSHVQVLPKSGTAHNELSKFRYDVVLHVQGPPAAESQCDWLAWQWESPQAALQALRQILDERPRELGLRGVPNARTAADACLVSALENRPELQTVAELRRELMSTNSGMEPESLRALGQELGFRFEASWLSGDPEGRYDVWFCRTDEATMAIFPPAAEPSATRNWQAYANSPGQAAKDRTLALELRDYLGQRLPDYMVPAAFVLLEAWPLTAHGKLDRQALPVPEGTEDRPDLATGYVAPCADVEKALAGIWADLLELEKIGIHDNFFELGGHSLLATQVIARLQSEIGVAIPITVFFAKPTVAELAAWVEANRSELHAETGAPLQAAPIAASGRREAPQSFAQQRLWFLSQLAPGSSLYNTLGVISLRGAVDLDALERTLSELVRRHESLRTTFDARDGEPIQRVAPPLPVQLDPVDLRQNPAVERRAELQYLRQAETARPFDLARGPLVRFKLVLLEEHRQALLVAMHHIITDGWSMGVLRREFNALYEAFRTGRPSPLPELPIQYADFALWQQQWSRSNALQQQLEYWKEKLAGTSRLELPTDRPRPARQDYQGKSQSLVLPGVLSDQLAALSRHEGATLFMTLLAALQVLLGRYTRQTDIAVGSPIAGRTRAETEGLIGCFLNTLVLRTDLSGDPAFRELLRRVREVALSAYAHQEVPFEMLLEVLRPERSVSHSHSPLFQVFFNMLEERSIQETRLRSEPSGVFDAAAKFDLEVYAQERPDGLSLKAVYNADIFEASTIEHLLGHFRTLLEGVVADPDQRISALPLLTRAERWQLSPSGVGAGSRGDFPTARCREFRPADVEQSIPERFAEQVRRYPDRLAVKAGQYEWTYAELNDEANRVAQGITAGADVTANPVALLFEHGAPMVAAVLGVLKAGRAYVPLDPSSPRERLRHVLDHCGADTLLVDTTNRSLGRELGESGLHLVSIDDLAAAPPGNDITVCVPPGAVAYLLYTSGSTGRPKGVAQTHRGVLHHIRVYANAFAIGANDRLTLLSAYGFDAAVVDLFGALLTGAALCPIHFKTQGPEGLASALDGVTVYHSTPSLYRAFVATLGVPGAPDSPGRFPTVRLVVLGGEAATAADAQLCRAHFAPDCRFVNLMGQTEASITMLAVVERETPLTRHAVATGYPVEGTEVLLLDSAGRDAEVYGEVAIRSPYVALGYWREPALTAQRFVPDPAAGTSAVAPPGARLFLTGDLGRLLPDGSIEFRGRTDWQVKVRGYRVELGEIEAALCAHPAVREAVALVYQDEDETAGEQQLVSYFVAREQAVPDAAELRRFLKEALPDYMVPQSFIALDSMPRTPRGKLDRGALPKPERNRPELGMAYIAAGTSMEELVAGIWAKLLRREQVGTHDNFFDLGGHSLLATQVSARLKAEVGLAIPISVFFAKPTVAELAEWIEANRGEQQADTVAPLLAAPFSASGRREAPQSFAQQRLWFLSQLARGSSLYNTLTVITLHGVLHLDALERTLSELVRRHESLRTTFDTRDGEPIQRVAPPLPVHLDPVDLRRRPASERRVELQHLREAEATRPYDLTRGPLARFKLALLEKHWQVLIVGMHHIITDGWSTGVLRREFSALYEAFRAGRPSPLPELPVQYADFALWQRRWMRGEVLQKQLNYWQVKLAGIENLALPTERPRPKVPRYNSAREPFEIDPEVAAKLHDLSRREEATLFMTLLAAFQVVLGRYSGQDDVVVGTPIANRTRTELEGVIGFFVNTLVMRSDLSGNPSFRQLLQRVRQTCLEAYAHQDLPFERLVEELAPQRDLGVQPLFQVLFVLNVPQAGETPARQRSASSASTAAAGELIYYDLTLAMREQDSVLSGVLHFNTELFTPETAAGMVRHLQALLVTVTEQPDQELAAALMLSGQERARMLVACKQTSSATPQRCIHQLFEEQVDRTPDRIAITFDKRQLSYRDLDRRANQVAHHLRALGVRPELPVGLYMERGPEAIVGLLGILKAGGVYLPLDPSLPPQRLSWFLDDAHPALVLTQQTLRQSLPPCAAPALCIDDPNSGLRREPDSRPAVAIAPRQLAYVIYTSGSTGRPKGVTIEHHSLSYTITAQIPLFGLNSQGLDDGDDPGQ